MIGVQLEGPANPMAILSDCFGPIVSSRRGARNFESPAPAWEGLSHRGVRGPPWDAAVGFCDEPGADTALMPSAPLGARSEAMAHRAAATHRSDQPLQSLQQARDDLRVSFLHLR